MSGTGRPRLDASGRPAGRRRLRRGRLIVVGLLLVPLVELFVTIQVGRWIGGGLTVLLLIAGCLAGVAVLRRVGAAALRQVPKDRRGAGAVIVGGGSSATAAAATALLVPAGLLLLFPGFVTDAAGLILLIPGVRRVLSRRIGDAVMRRVQWGSGRIVRGSVVDVRVVDDDLTPPDGRPGPRTPAALPGPPPPTADG